MHRSTGGYSAQIERLRQALRDADAAGGRDAEDDGAALPGLRQPMSMNLRADDTFVEDEGWHVAAERYAEFLRRHISKRRRSPDPGPDRTGSPADRDLVTTEDQGGPFV